MDHIQEIPIWMNKGSRSLLREPLGSLLPERNRGEIEVRDCSRCMKNIGETHGQKMEMRYWSWQ